MKNSIFSHLTLVVYVLFDAIVSFSHSVTMHTKILIGPYFNFDIFYHFMIIRILPFNSNKFK